ncbi:MAG: PPOX class F420-dependent oxidoreductase [Streptosporangiaceae bacterium]
MALTQPETDYLASQRIGRLATMRPDGTLQNNPVGFRYNAEAGTIDIGGFNMSASRKFANVAANGRVAFVVDDIVSVSPWRVRCLEIRGTAEAVVPDGNPGGNRDQAIIRIHPQRVISFGLDDLVTEPHLLKADARNIG